MSKVTVSGKLRGSFVCASWEDGEVSGDPELINAARAFARTNTTAAVGQPYAAAPANLREPYSFAMTVACALDPATFHPDGLEAFLPETTRS
jgi:hypothetical protein